LFIEYPLSSRKTDTRPLHTFFSLNEEKKKEEEGGEEGGGRRRRTMPRSKKWSSFGK